MRYGEKRRKQFKRTNYTVFSSFAIVVPTTYSKSLTCHSSEHNLNQKDECCKARNFACKKSRGSSSAPAKACMKVISKGSQLKHQGPLGNP